MKVIYVPRDFFEWLGEKMNENARFGSPPSEKAPLMEIRWKDRLTIRPKGGQEE